MRLENRENLKMRTTIFKEMSRQTDAAARRAIVELLDAAAADLSFTPGSGLHVSCANEVVTVWLRCLRTEGQRSYYAGVVTAGFPPRAEVVGIPWRLMDFEGQPMGGGVTGTGGHFSFALTVAEDKLSQPLSLRFGEPATPDAPRAEADLEQRSDFVPAIARVLAEFRQAKAGRSDIRPVMPQAILRRLERQYGNKWHCKATVAAGFHGELAGNSADEGPQPDESEGWIVVQNDQVVVRAPADLVPYGVVRILAQVADQLVGACLLPLIQSEASRPESATRTNSCQAQQVVGARDPRTINWYAQPAGPDTLAWFPADELAKLLQRPDVLPLLLVAPQTVRGPLGAVDRHAGSRRRRRVLSRPAGDGAEHAVGRLRPVRSVRRSAQHPRIDAADLAAVGLGGSIPGPVEFHGADRETIQGQAKPGSERSADLACFSGRSAEAAVWCALQSAASDTEHPLRLDRKATVTAMLDAAQRRAIRGRRR
jgi:hypothetical protein